MADRFLRLETPDGRPRPASEVLAQLQDHDGGDVLLDGGTGRSPHLLNIVRAAGRLGRVVLAVPGSVVASPARASLLHQAGVRTIALRASDPEHEAASTALEAAGLRRALALRTGDVELQALGGRQESIFVVDNDPSHDAARVHEARRLGIRLRGPAFQPWPAPHGDPSPMPVDPDIEARLAHRALHPIDLAGTLCSPPEHASALRMASRDPAALIETLGAAGIGALDAPACLLGRGTAPPQAASLRDGCAPCPHRTSCEGLPDVLGDPGPRPAWRPLPVGARVVVVDPGTVDPLLAASTLPALVHALRLQGVDAHLASVRRVRFHPTRLRDPVPRVRRLLDRLALPGQPVRIDARDPLPPIDDGARDALRRQIARLRPDVIVTPALSGTAWLDALDAPDGVRWVLLDLHKLDGADAFRTLTQRGADVVVHACFPRFAALYRRHDLDVHCIHWRPYPLWRPHLRGPPPTASRTLLSAGNHARDPETLDRLLRATAGRTHPWRVLGHGVSSLARHGVHADEGLSVVDWLAAIRTSRFVVLPLQDDPVRAAGISTAAAALAAGRPVIASRTPAMIDHIEDGVSGILVPPGDPDALADAVLRLDADTGLLDRLEQGAARASIRLGVDAWAAEIVHGAPIARPHRGSDGLWRLWR